MPGQQNSEDGPSEDCLSEKTPTSLMSPSARCAERRPHLAQCQGPPAQLVPQLLTERAHLVRGALKDNRHCGILTVRPWFPCVGPLSYMIPAHEEAYGIPAFCRSRKRQEARILEVDAHQFHVLISSGASNRNSHESQTASVARRDMLRRCVVVAAASPLSLRASHCAFLDIEALARIIPVRFTRPRRAIHGRRLR